MSVAASPHARTFFDALVEALEGAGAYNKQDQVAPAAVLWPDKECLWEALLPLLKGRLPVFVLGAYAPEQQAGPAYWLRCIISRTIPHAAVSAGQVPILYLPGFSRQDVRAGEDCPPALKPLAEFQYRGVVWTQKNGRDWSIAAFIQSKDSGLGVDVAADTATRQALRRSLLKLASQAVEVLGHEAPIRAPFLDALLHPDDEQAVLRWIDDPAGFRTALSPDQWASFVALCQNRYRFNPETDGSITAARLLGERDGAWDTVWRRFAEAPANYVALPDVLRQARPARLPLLANSPESWPQENEAAETALRESLADLASVDAQAAQRAILKLEQEHGQRRIWVWAAIGRAPLASALEYLAILATEAAQSIGGSSVSDITTAYAQRGWRADISVLDALAAIETSEDLAAVRTVVRTIYRPWLEAGAASLQKIVSKAPCDYVATPPLTPTDGTCILLSDALRYDIAQRLKGLLESRGLECASSVRLAPLPGITGTAKPAISPAAGAFTGASSTGLEPVLPASGAKATAETLRKALEAAHIQVLRGDDLGDPTRIAWTELGKIDSYGHDYGWGIAHHLAGELRALERRVGALLEHGWQQVLVVTDHGWLLMPGGLPKADLPEHLTEVRKGRCARLKEGASTDQQVVPWHWDPSVRIAMAPGIHCYETGKEYEHGGLSPQECVVPLLTVHRAAKPEEPISIDSVTWRRLRCAVMVKGVRPGMRVDLRTRAGDATTSLVNHSKELAGDGTAALLVDDEGHEGDGAVVVVLGADGSVRAQTGTVVGG